MTAAALPRATSAAERAHDPYVDGWTPVHFLIGVLLGLSMPALWALVVLVLWEPFVFIFAAPRLRGKWDFLDQRTQLSQPTLRNVLVDLVADVAGVAMGAFWLAGRTVPGPV